MILIDKIYYLLYCSQYLSNDAPSEEADKERYEKGISNAQGLFFLSNYIYIICILSYTGLFFFINSTDSRKMVAVGILGVMLLFNFLYLRNRAEKIVILYNTRRGGVRKIDSILGLVYGVGAFVMVGGFFLLRNAGAPLPLIQAIFKIPVNF